MAFFRTKKIYQPFLFNKVEARMTTLAAMWLFLAFLSAAL